MQENVFVLRIYKLNYLGVKERNISKYFQRVHRHFKMLPGTSTSSQNGVIGIKFTLLPETILKMNKVYKISFLNTLDIRK